MQSNIVQRLEALIERQRDARGDMLYKGSADPELVDARAKITRLTEALRAAEEREKGFVDALIWCSGSADFNEGGQAREGWLKLCRPLIDAALKGPSHDAS